MKRSLALLILVTGLIGCVWVGERGTYSRTDSVEMGGTNTVNKHHRIDIDPK